MFLRVRVSTAGNTGNIVVVSGSENRLIDQCDWGRRDVWRPVLTKSVLQASQTESIVNGRCFGLRCLVQHVGLENQAGFDFNHAQSSGGASAMELLPVLG